MKCCTLYHTPNKPSIILILMNTLKYNTVHSFSLLSHRPVSCEMSKAQPFTLEDLQRWTAEANKDVTSNNTCEEGLSKARPMTVEDVLDGADEGKVDYQSAHDSSKNNAYDSKKQRGQRLGYGAKKRVKP